VGGGWWVVGGGWSYTVGAFVTDEKNHKTHPKSSAAGALSGVRGWGRPGRRGNCGLGGRRGDGRLPFLHIFVLLVHGCETAVGTPGRMGAA
jgi:hypothetical protein